jgi:hypothetical protein
MRLFIARDLSLPTKCHVDAAHRAFSGSSALQGGWRGEFPLYPALHRRGFSGRAEPYRQCAPRLRGWREEIAFPSKRLFPSALCKHSALSPLEKGEEYLRALHERVTAKWPLRRSDSTATFTIAGKGGSGTARQMPLPALDRDFVLTPLNG